MSCHETEQGRHRRVRDEYSRQPILDKPEVRDLQARIAQLIQAGDKLAAHHLRVVVTFDEATKHVAEWHRQRGEA